MPNKEKKKGLGPSDDSQPWQRDTRIRVGKPDRPDFQFHRTHETNLSGPPVRKPKLDMPRPFSNSNNLTAYDIIREHGFKDYKHKGDYDKYDPRGWKDQTMRNFYMALEPRKYK